MLACVVRRILPIERCKQRDRLLLNRKRLAVHVRHIEKLSLLRLERGVEPAGDAGLGEPQRGGIAFIGARRPAKHIARKLIHDDHQREQTARRLLPTDEAGPAAHFRRRRRNVGEPRSSNASSRRNQCARRPVGEPEGQNVVGRHCRPFKADMLTLSAPKANDGFAPSLGPRASRPQTAGGTPAVLGAASGRSPKASLTKPKKAANPWDRRAEETTRAGIKRGEMSQTGFSRLARFVLQRSEAKRGRSPHG